MVAVCWVRSTWVEYMYDLMCHLIKCFCQLFTRAIAASYHYQIVRIDFIIGYVDMGKENMRITALEHRCITDQEVSRSPNNSSAQFKRSCCSFFNHS